MSLRVRVTGGHITAEPANAIIVAIDSALWSFSEIDWAIMRLAGGLFHNQAANHMPMHDGDVIYAPKYTRDARVTFDSVIFVVDDRKHPLQHVILAGLQEAEGRRLPMVTLPLFRIGAPTDFYYRFTVTAALDETIAAIRQFVASKPCYVEQLTVVVPHDRESVSYLQGQLQLA